MRFTKRIVISLLAFEGVAFAALVAAQICTGYDFSAAYAFLGSLGGVELALTSVLKIVEAREEARIKKEEKHEQSNQKDNQP